MYGRALPFLYLDFHRKTALIPLQTRSNAGYLVLSLPLPFNLEITCFYSASLQFLSVAVCLGHVGKEIEDTAGVAPLIVVPGDELDKVVV